MLFPTLQFAIFFGLTLLLHRSLPLRARSGILLGASLIFYALWIPPYIFLLLGDILVNYGHIVLFYLLAEFQHQLEAINIWITRVIFDDATGGSFSAEYDGLHLIMGHVHRRRIS